MSKQKALIEIELSNPNNHPDVIEHYNKVLHAVENPEFEGLKILIFQPVCTGDLICSSLCAELFQIKYPGCTLDYLTENQVNADAIKNNPFINLIGVSKSWDLFKKRDTLEDGDLKKEYDMGYSLYWWTKPCLIQSFLDSLELPINYTRLKLYRNFEYQEEIKNKYPKTRFRICLQAKNDIRAKWNVDENYEVLKKGLEEIGEVIELGTNLSKPYDWAIELLRQSDLFVGAEGSLSHAAGAVGCQSISLSSVYDPNWVAPQTYQNKYILGNRKHVSVRPVNWCGDYHCMDMDNSKKHLTHPPYGYSSEPKVAPYKFMDCDYKGFKRTCIHEISPEHWLEVIKTNIKD